MEFSRNDAGYMGEGGEGGVFQRKHRMIESFIFRQFRDKWSVALTGHYNDISKVSTGRSTEEASSRFRSDFVPFFLDTSFSP